MCSDLKNASWETFSVCNWYWHIRGTIKVLLTWKRNIKKTPFNSFLVFFIYRSPNVHILNCNTCLSVVWFLDFLKIFFSPCLWLAYSNLQTNFLSFWWTMPKFNGHQLGWWSHYQYVYMYALHSRKQQSQLLGRALSLPSLEEWLGKVHA